ncbi:MAG: S16 family serine protease [Candidatus Anstonellaceae archaeon]
MLNFFRVLVFLLFSYNIFFSFCPEGEVEFFVPAVINPSSSQIVKITLKTTYGNGNIYVSISPPVGILAQQSISRAINYAFSSEANLSKCDVLVNFDKLENSSLVEGPSASLAIALATKAILNNLSYPDSVIVTGEIFSNGVVGPVGGIIDKIKAAQKENKTKIITPTLYFYERLLLSSFEKNITVIEVKNFEEAYNYLFLNLSYSPSESIPSVIIPTQLQARRSNSNEKEFESIARSISKKLEDTINSYSNLFKKSPQLESYLDYFKQRIELNNFLISKGYFYSAANNAFLDLMDAKLLKQASNLNPNLQEEFIELISCLENFKEVQLTKENFEFAAGAEARYIWAKTKYQNLKNASSSISSIEEKYLILREIYSAQSWCLASLDLIKKAKEASYKSNTPLNTSLMEKAIKENITLLSSLLENSQIEIYQDLQEAKVHLNYAKAALEEKKYAGAMFDLAYALSVINFAKEKTQKDEQILKNIESLSSKSYFGFWANLYHSQGQYLYFISKTPQERLTSYSAFLLAEAEEEFLTNVDEFIARGEFSAFSISPTKNSTSLKNIYLEDLLVSAIILISLTILLYLLFDKSLSFKSSRQ